ncbi:hypothetical protein L6164_017213 [Bauhinia variegata]|uniref:Uncharacterized protein n=1 Tax=Bauhinia variegata TaxID=167791 RepID=A0ACB9N8H9_BAUVA|nr:hypothetical protein L6164_017213 [Bauhinia variegata]
MSKEFQALGANHTWDLVKLPKRKKHISCKWVYKIKHKANGSVECYKAHLAALSFTCGHGLNNTQFKTPTGVLRLCYKISDTLSFPVITAHFEGGNLKLSTINAYVEVSEDVWCLAFSRIDNGAILGNQAQAEILFHYDIQNKAIALRLSELGSGPYEEARPGPGKGA